ncbi:hypothetical protein [Bacillus sp. UMB0893]|uniref:hypothetical protein n=1 Tax=Bacillus sp. UMB0893 TaxID=2066053 RepID=UPI000C76CAC3|nr:hypothetical protein [Bacillus sp. UMB0893]PLR66405.1 hypothetical protein CYJ36_17290 [Bacillus sp. UMB0893]
MGTFLKAICAAAILLAAVYFRFLYSSPFAATWDQVDFALALNRYDLLAMQPHFPGYPYFILGGMIAHIWVDNPAQALSVFNQIVVLSASIPIYFLAKQYIGALPSLMAVLLLQTNSYLSILSAQPMSEGAAIGVLWWYLWAVYLAFNKKAIWMKLLPLFLFSILMGIRLSYAPFGLAIVFLWIKDYKESKSMKRIAAFALAAVLFQSIWIAGLIMNEGSLAGFIKLSYGFVAGHFTSWGGAVTESGEPVWSRLYRLIVHNVVFTGMMSQSYLLIAAGAGVILWFFMSLSRKAWIEYLNSHKLMLSLTLVYFLWNLFAQNIDKPRHSFPITMLLLFTVYVFLAGKTKKGHAVFIMLAVLQLAVSIPLLKEQAKSMPAVYQMAEYLEEQEKPLIVYTWEETRVLSYLSVPYDHKRYYSYPYFQKDVSYQKGKSIYLTNHLAEGFEKQGIELEGQLEKIKEFHSNPLFDPVYGDIVLYRLKER